MPTSYTQININDLLPSPYQIRDNDNLDLDDLTASISQDGAHNPIRVRPFETKYQVISGHRRLSASKQAGLKAIWCLVQ
jgi:ParB family chromosome partitioning protein